MADNLKPIIYTRKASRKINDAITEVVCSNFGDRLFVAVTQFGKIGTLIHINNGICSDAGQSETIDVDVKVLMGKDEVLKPRVTLTSTIVEATCSHDNEPLTYVIAKQIASSLYTSGALQPILLGIAMKDCNPETLKQIIKLIHENSVW